MSGERLGTQIVILVKEWGQSACPSCGGSGVVPWGNTTTLEARCETCRGCGIVQAASR